MITRHSLYLALFSIIISAGAPALANTDSANDKTAAVDKVPQKTPAISAAIQAQYGRPAWHAIVKNIIAFGGPLAVMIIANRKLKKDSIARKIQLQEQQEVQGANNPMAQLMAMMQQQNAGGGMFPGAEVRQPATATPAKQINPEDMVESKPYEQDILTPGMRRFWMTMSWVSGALALVFGLGLGFNTYAAISGKSVPGAMHAGKNVLQGVVDCVDEIKKGNFSDPDIAAMEAYQRLLKNEDYQKVQNIYVPGEPAQGEAMEQLMAAAKARATHYCNNVHQNAHHHLQNNWFAKASRTAFGTDIISRFLMLFKDFSGDVKQGK